MGTSEHPVPLPDGERDELRRLTGGGAAPARRLTRARVLLKADQGVGDAAIADALGIHPTTAWRVRRRFAGEGFASALAHERPPGPSRPAGRRARWTPRPLADAPVGLRLVPRVPPETVRRAQENDLAPHLKRQWRIPPEASGAFASAVEDVLDLCERACDPARPVVRFDERPCQLLAEARPGTPIAPGRPARHDDEHRRTGSANAFGYFEPLRGWREVEVAARRTKQDVARCLRRLADGFYPHADTVPVALDNLGTHTKAALYAAFPPAEARRLARRIGFHDTPKHGSWTNAVEIELAALSKPCLDRRIGDLDTLAHEAAAVDRRSRTAAARIRLRRPYPTTANPSGR